MWSPRRLAELAGISRRAVRHYHEIGLLPEPRRRPNGYQQYGVDHLIRLLRIRRLAQLGLTLPQIAAVGDTDHPPLHVLRELETELTRTIERLHETRSDLVAVIEHATPLELPAPIALRAQGLPTAERALVVVLSRLLGPRALEAYLTLLPSYRDHAAVLAFDNLPSDTDSVSRTVVADAIAHHVHHLAGERAGQFQIIDAGLRASPSTRQTVQQAITDLYNPAQLDVLSKARRSSDRARR